MFRTLIYPTSGACDYSIELPHWSYCSWFDVCWRYGVLQPATRIPLQPNHTESNTHRTRNNTTNVVIEQNSRKFLLMDILMSETCWAHKKWNKIASDIKLVFYSSTYNVFNININTARRHAGTGSALLPTRYQRKGKGIYLQARNSKRGRGKWIAPLFLNLTQDGDEYVHALAALPRGKGSEYLLDRRLRGCQMWPGNEPWSSSPLPGHYID